MSLYIDNLVSEGLVDTKALRTAINVLTVSASTQTLLATDAHQQIYAGTVAGQIVKMPDATTVQLGHRFQLNNDSTQNVTMQDNAGGALTLLGPNQRAFLVCSSTANAAGTWSFLVVDKFASGKDDFTVTYPGSGLGVNYTGGNARFNGVFSAIAAGTLTLPASITNGFVYVATDGTVKASASLPDNVLPLYQFTSSATAVTALTDIREDIDQNLVWGAVGDIVGTVAGQAKSAGTLEKYARADHVHGNNLLLTKSGTIAANGFTGAGVKTSVVAFATAFANTSYSVRVTGVDARVWTISGKAAGGFTISANAAQALSGAVDWEATATGEST